jgi:hypothetical protein
MALNLGDFQDHQMVQESCTYKLRWNGDVLEQMWHLTTIVGNKAVGVEDEWRPVPQISDGLVI